MALQDVRSIEEYLEYIKRDLQDKAPDSSGALSDSINYKLENVEGPLNMGFEMNEYGIYLDKGVSGTKKKYNTPYGFTTKGPPPRSLDRWIVRTGIAPRDKNGKLLPRKSIQFMLSRSIKEKGIRPRDWINPVLDDRLDGLGLVLAEAIWQDFENKENSK